MRIFEITQHSRKTIKQLSRLYLEYTLDSRKYSGLISYMDTLSQSSDHDVIRELRIINEKLKDEMIRILSK